LQQPRSPGAQRRAHRQLALPRHTARQHQVGDVDTGDQQHHANAPEQQQHRRAHRPDGLLMQGDEMRGPAGVHVRIAGRQLLPCRREVRACGLDTDAVFQPRDHRVHARAAIR
jgi:hypothetical protein